MSTDSGSVNEPEPLTRRTYVAAALTVACASVSGTIRGRTGQALGLGIVCVAVLTGIVVSPVWGWAVIGAPLAATLLLVPVLSFWIPLWNVSRSDRRAWVGQDGRAFVTARLDPPLLYPDNASARHIGRGEAIILLDQLMAYADANGLTVEFTASNEKVGALYASRYGAVTVGRSWGRPRMRRTPGSGPK